MRRNGRATMLMKVEPKGVAMFTVYFYFNKAQPDPEDEAIKSYMRERGITPKRQASAEYQGVACQVMQFGSCYLTPFIGDIKELQRKGAQQALLTMEVERVLAEEATEEVRKAMAGLGPERVAEAKAAVVRRFQEEASFGTDAEGYAVMTVAAEALREAFLREAGRT